MIESHRQIGHRRRIGPPSASAHSASRLFCAAESEINRIVTTGALLRADLAKILVRRWSPHLREKSDWKRISLPDWVRSFTPVWPVNCRKLTQSAKSDGPGHPQSRHSYREYLRLFQQDARVARHTFDGAASGFGLPFPLREPHSLRLCARHSDRLNALRGKGVVQTFQVGA